MKSARPEERGLSSFSSTFSCHSSWISLTMIQCADGSVHRSFLDAISRLLSYGEVLERVGVS